MFTIEFPNPENNTVQITITDITGKNISETTTTREIFNYSISTIPAGIYIVTVKGENTLNVSKMFVN